MGREIVLFPCGNKGFKAEMKEKTWTYLAVALLSLFAVFVLVKHEKETIRMNGQEYRHTGMMEYRDGNTVVYLPVFRRTK